MHNPFVPVIPPNHRAAARVARLFCAALVITPLGPGLPASRADTFWPPHTVVNVKTQYGAVGDGVADDTGPLQRAVSENVGGNKPLYFPPGTYLVKGQLPWRSADPKRPWRAGLALVGEGPAQTVIRLQDGAAGFGDPAAPQAVVYTASYRFESDDDPSYLQAGTGNEAFNNFVENLTIDTGNNPGAIGIDYLASNIGALRNLVVRGNGPVGVNVSRAFQGPALIRNVSVEGFDYGFLCHQGQYSLVFEHVTVTGQRLAGLLSDQGLAISIRDFQSVNQVPALVADNVLGLVDLTDARCTGGAPGESAIHNNQGQMVLRNVVTGGYGQVLVNAGAVVPGASLDEWTSVPPSTLFPLPNAPRTLGLPVAETPAPVLGTAADWADVEDYNAHGTNSDGSMNWDDDTAGLQAALDSGKPNILLRGGTYLVSRTLHVPATVQRIVGYGASVAPGYGCFADATQPAAMFSVEGDSPVPLTVERFGFSRVFTSSDAPLPLGLVVFAHASPRTMVFKDFGDTLGTVHNFYEAGPGAGQVFLEGVSANGWKFGPSQQVWARQFNPEGDTLRVANAGADLWILGLKSEGHGSIIDTSANGRTELLGGNLYENVDLPADLAAFTVEQGAVSLSIATTNFHPYGNDFAVLVREQHGSDAGEFKRDDAIWRGDGRIMTLFVGDERPPTPTPAPAATPTPTPAPAATPTPTPTPSRAPLPSATPTPSAAPTPRPGGPTATPAPTGSPTPVTPAPASPQVHVSSVVLRKARSADAARAGICEVRLVVDGTATGPSAGQPFRLRFVVQPQPGFNPAAVPTKLPGNWQIPAKRAGQPLKVRVRLGRKKWERLRGQYLFVFVGGTLATTVGYGPLTAP